MCPEARVRHWHSIMTQTQRIMSQLLNMSGSQHNEKETIKQLLILRERMVLTSYAFHLVSIGKKKLQV